MKAQGTAVVPARDPAAWRGVWPPMGTIRVLLFEDQPADLCLIHEELDDAFTMEVVEVSSLADGLARLREGAFDIAVLDLGLPDSVGLSTFTVLRAAAPNLPILVFSGLLDANIMGYVLRHGAQDYLVKGASTNGQLARSIRFTIERQRLAAQLEQRASQLQESEAQLRALLDVHSDALIVIDRSGVVRFANPMAMRMFGSANRRRLVGHPFGFPTVNGQATELDILRDTGAPGVAEMRVVTTRWGQEPAFLACLRDITDLKRAQDDVRMLNEQLERRVIERTRELEQARQRAESSDRLKSVFLATMSHELRTPLNAIIGFSELLIRGKPGPLNAQQQDYLTDVLLSGRHLLNIINSVLDLSKLEAGMMTLRPEPFRVSAAVHEVCAVLAPLAQSKGIGLTPKVDPDIDAVTLDLGKFKQILYNLLSNAIKFTGEGGRVDVVAVRGAADRIELSVSDTGIGIRPQDLDKLFVEFQQLDTGTGRRYDGTGLGLALTKKLVHLQDGAIQVRSEFGRGTTFTVELPRTQPRRSA